MGTLHVQSKQHEKSMLESSLPELREVAQEAELRKRDAEARRQEMLKEVRAAFPFLWPLCLHAT